MALAPLNGNTADQARFFDLQSGPQRADQPKFFDLERAKAPSEPKFFELARNKPLSGLEPGEPGESQAAAKEPKKDLREAFQEFVGSTFFGEMIKSMRSTQDPPKYLHGGQAEKIFQGQFDQKLAEELSKSSADKIADPMFALFQLPRAS